MQAAARQCEVIGIEMVAETEEYAWSKVEAESSYQRVTLFPEKATRAMIAKEMAARMHASLAECRPDAVAIPGWSNNGAFAAIQWCGETGTPAVLMSESTAQDEPRVWWREKIKRNIVRLYSTALVGGQRHVDYLAELGMPRDRIFTGYDTVDNAFFAQGAKEARRQRTEDGSQKAEDRSQKSEDRSQRTEVRREARTAGDTFSRRRGLSKRRICSRCCAHTQRIASARHLSLVTRHFGASFSSVMGRCGNLSTLNSQLSTCTTRVQMPGFKQYDELPMYYAHAKAFVHASTTEQWGLVVNEAIASGLPVIVSNRCGCVPELVREGENGFTFDPFNEQELTECLLQMSSMPEAERASLGQTSSRIATEYDVDRFGIGLKSAAELAMSLPRRRASVVDHALLWALMRK